MKITTLRQADAYILARPGWYKSKANDYLWYFRGTTTPLMYVGLLGYSPRYRAKWGVGRDRFLDLNEAMRFVEALAGAAPAAAEPPVQPEPPASPGHYAALSPQPIEVIEAWDLNFNLGNVVKYIGRAGRKNGESARNDLSKALDYLQREVNRLSKEDK